MDLAGAGSVSRVEKAAIETTRILLATVWSSQCTKAKAKPYQQLDIGEAIRTVTKEGNHP